MCRDELSRAHSALVSAAIRLAECMGLHRDPTQYGLSPIEIHVRRLLWYQLCFLDIRTCEVHGPRPTLRRDEFDTQMPLNIDDIELLSTGDPKEQDRFTDMTVMRVRFETNEMLRVLWVDRLRLERKAITLTHILGKVEAFRKAFNERYMPMLDDSVPVQKFTKILMRLFMTRMHVMLLHRYHSTMGNDCPDRLRQLLLASGTEGLECAVELETDPAIIKWSWYAGAFQQYHTAILLLMEIYAFPMRKEGDRIWRCLDYIFDADPQMPRHLKGHKLLSEMRDKFGVYRDMRKMRAPVTLKRPVEDPGSGKALTKGSTSREEAAGSSSPSSKAKGRNKGSTAPTPQIPLNFDMVNWQPVRPALQQQDRRPSDTSSTSLGQTAPGSSRSPRSPSAATTSQPRGSNWGFDSPQTFLVVNQDKPTASSRRTTIDEPQSWGQHPANTGQAVAGYPTPTPTSATSSVGSTQYGNGAQPARSMPSSGPPIALAARLSPGYGAQQPSPALVTQLSHDQPTFYPIAPPPLGIDDMMNDIDWVSMVLVILVSTFPFHSMSCTNFFIE